MEALVLPGLSDAATMEGDLMAKALTSATAFMRDNTSGDRVRSGNVTPSGGLVYRMESGNTYRLSPAEAATLARFGFRPRYVPGADLS